MHENSQTWIHKGRAEVRKYPSVEKKPEHLKKRVGTVLRRFKSEDTANKWAKYRSNTHHWMKYIYNPKVKKDKSLLTDD